LRLPAGFRVGVATHTGMLRSGNEDDYLLLAPGDAAKVAGMDELSGSLVAAVADGMGGVAGGAEASRACLRGLAWGILQAPVSRAEDPEVVLTNALKRGFAGACRRVYEQAQLVPSLREMGSTLTVMVVGSRRLVLGHLGDTRAYRLRGEVLEQLTEDHAVPGQAHRLLRCVGAGQEAEEPDVSTSDLLPADRFLLCSDGVWSTVGSEQIAAQLARDDPQAAAERLVELANAAGGPDNSTVVVIHRTESVTPHDVALPSVETSMRRELDRDGRRLGPPRWPWLLLGLSAALAGWLLARSGWLG
jgi:serine/threonine protein phosphatase PrpC